ncbi:hypothetical protein EC912_106171 [Luteibacter rhizovicinus]|uniref:Uncharacterized protein n=1 Tax=Luteibacter rhizovicinus TaxID=242606 RepID=A0A4R3YL06_9GAMM|nr:hypothetical protein [Luteibacter rhizovicinus]TCV92832.1 hypothetical protein EC912_106171 [Luteibacter rhizovicinus]
MRLLFTIAPLTLAAILAACSPSSPETASASASAPATEPAPGKTAPANPALGSPDWYAWVDRTLAVSDDGHGPAPGTPEWNSAVQTKLGEEAPQQKSGSTEWQQAVDALLRTRVATH